MAKAARRDGGVGSATRAARASRCRASLGGTRDRIASGVSIGIQDSLDELAGEGRARARRRLPADQDQDQAGLGPRRRSRRVRATLRRDPADGRRQRGLHARRRAITSPQLDRVRPDDDRAAARLRRHRATTPTLQRRLQDADLPRRVDQDRRASRATRSTRRRLPHHQHQAGPRRRLQPSRSAARSLRARTASRCGTAACSESGIGRAAQHPPRRRCRTSACPATSPPASATSIPT